MKKTTRIRISDIQVTPALQSRANLDGETAEEYGRLIAEGVKLPPIECIATDGGIVAVDGFHRIEGAKQVGHDSIEAIVTQGTWADAVWAAAGANRTHGLKRSVADKRRAVAMLLGDMTFAVMSDRELAKQVGVTHPFVASMRKRLESIEHETAETETDEIVEEIEAEADEPEATATVEERMKEAKRVLREIEQQVSACESALVEIIEREDHGAFLSSSIVPDLRDIRSRIRMAMPHKPCPYCHGEGCATCKGRGWVGRLFWDTAVPEELKG
jgi:hypothetical protein